MAITAELIGRLGGGAEVTRVETSIAMNGATFQEIITIPVQHPSRLFLWLEWTGDIQGPYGLGFFSVDIAGQWSGTVMGLQAPPGNLKIRYMGEQGSTITAINYLTIED